MKLIKFKRLLSIITIICVLSSGIIIAYADSGMTNFKRNENVGNNPFVDTENTWYTEDVQTVYDYRIMVGRSSSEFAPDDFVTRAEIITIASRIHQMYLDGTILDTLNNSDNSAPWYDDYLQYAIENRIIKNDEFQDVQKTASRAETAGILRNALPAEEWTAINSLNINNIPDVYENNLYASEILELYQAGILNGIDTDRTFCPVRNIKRCEVAAIIHRMICPEIRLKDSCTENDILLPLKNSTLNISGNLSTSMKAYTDISELYKASYDVIVADVIETGQTSTDDGTLNVALSEVKILNSYKGRLKQNQTICIEETGLRQENFDLAIDGVPLLNKKMRVILFITEPSNVIQKTKESYGIIGVYQGKYFVDQNNHIYSSSTYSDNALSLITWNEGDSIENFERKLFSK